MPKSSKIFAALFFLHATVALGKTYYVDKSCAQNGNGTTTICGTNGPWNSLGNIGCGSLGTDDIVEIRGGTYYGQWVITGACSGTAGHPHVFQNYANETVIIEGTTEHAGETWTSVGGGVWRSPTGYGGLGSQHYPYAGWFKATSGGAEEQVVVDQGRSATPGCGVNNFICTSSFPAVGRMTYNGANSQVCVHLSSGANPAAGFSFRLPTSEEPLCLFCSSPIPNYLTFRKNPAGGSFVIRRGRDYTIQYTDNVGLTFDGLEIYGANNRCVSEVPQGGSNPIANNRLLNNTIHQCMQECVHWQDNGTSSIIQGNTFYDCGDPVNFPADSGNSLCNETDGVTGLRIGASNVTIKNNMFYNIGGGTAVIPPFARIIDIENANSGFTIDGNAVWGTGLTGGQNGGPMAIVLGGLSGVMSNSRVINNLIYNTDRCLFLYESGPGTMSGSNNLVANNTCVNWVTEGFGSTGSWSATFSWTNNLFVKNNGNAPALRNGASYTPSRPTYGVYYCPNCTGNIINWNGTATASQASVGAYDANSFYGDPNISTIGSPPSLKIQSQSGTAHNHGTTIATFSTDFEGDTRPQGAVWDIGADEYSSGGPPAPTLLSVSPVP